MIDLEKQVQGLKYNSLDKSISFEKEDVGKNNGIHNDYSIGHLKPDRISERFLT